MKTNLSRTKAKEQIDNFFGKKDFTPEEVKKIKRLAMKFNIKLGAYKKMFCRKCLNKLAGKIRVSANFKTIECRSCSFRNRHKIG